MVQRSPNVIFFPAPVVVGSFARAHTAKIEAQHRNAQGIESLGGLIDYFVVHGPLIKRMWMTYHCRQMDLSRWLWDPQQSFEEARRAAYHHCLVPYVHS